MSAQPCLESEDEPEQRLNRMIALSMARPGDTVSVSGPDSLEVLGVLCRRQFSHVQCANFAPCAAANDQGDVLIFAGRLSGAELAQRLHATLGLLRSGGVVVAHLQDLDDDLALEAALQAHTCDVESTVFDLSHEVLVAHRIARRSSGAGALRRAA